MAMQSAASSDKHAEAADSKTWVHKLRREVGRVALQAGNVAARPIALIARCEFLFILGHMRSGSSLLCHLLCSSDDIIGYGETHNDYRRPSHLAKLLVSVASHTRTNPLRYRIVLDKIVGAQHVLDVSLLADRRTRYIFLVREPLATVASIVAMRRQFQKESQQQSIDFATKYYSERLSQLVHLAQTVDAPERCLLVTHQQLLGETQATFQALESFLHLSAPLRENYRLLPTTGRPGIGDPSPNIRLGRIDRSLPRKYVDLTPESTTQLEQCYARCVRDLQNLIPSQGSRIPVTAQRAA